MVNIFIIDDHDIIVEGIQFMVSDETDGIAVAGSARSVPEALEKLPPLKVDVLVLDLFLGKSSPLANLSLLKNTYPELPVMIFSAEESKIWKYRMFKAGANAFLSKCSENDVIMSTIRKIADGSVLLTGDMKDVFSQFAVLEKSDSYTHNEIELVYELCCGKSLQEIADQYKKSVSLIEKKLSALRKKANAQTNVNLIRIMISTGFIPTFN